MVFPTMGPYYQTPGDHDLKKLKSTLYQKALI
jgi:hypothetical protein